jgi:pilus assembly protein CpaF
MNQVGVDPVVERVWALARETPGELSRVVAGLVDRHAPLADEHDRAVITRRVVARLSGLGPLDDLLDDPTVDEVVVNRGHEIWVDRAGRWSRGGGLAPGDLERMLERVLAPLGRRVDRRTPVVDARMPDGSRLCAVIPPVAVDGPCLAVRRHRHVTPDLTSFTTDEVAALIRTSVADRSNLLVTGATSAGKTTLLATLLAELEPGERLVVVEDTTELPLGDRHAVRLETRPSGPDGLEPIDAGDLVRAALRLRPDRLVIGEFRGPEALAVVEALNTGHDGSLATCHANSAVDGLRRLETLLLQRSPSWPLAAIRRQITRSIDLVVHLRRSPDGRRTVAEVIEVVESDQEPTGRLLAVGGEVVGEATRSRR